jgi:uncharacterized lipoprotein YbaY
MRVRGTVRIGEVHAEVRDARTVVRLLDVSRADAAAETVAELTIPGCSLHPGEPGLIPFDLELPHLDPAATYALAAHVDVGVTGEVALGDYLTTQHHPVSERDVDRDIDLPAQAVE